MVAWVVKSGFLWWSKVATLVVKSGRPGGQKWSPGGGNKWLVPSGCHTSGQFSRHSVAWMMSIKMWWFLGMVVVSWWLQSPGSYSAPCQECKVAFGTLVVVKAAM